MTDGVTGRRRILKATLAILATSQIASSAEGSEKKKDDDETRPAFLPLPMTKAIPSTNERLAVLGVGTNNFSPTTADERYARREVLKALTDGGCSVIDTAPSYGRSEETIGDLLADLGNRKQAFLATKVKAPGGNLDAAKATIRESMTRLRTDQLDLVQVHSLNGVDVVIPYLLELKSKEKIRYIGITTSDNSQHAQMLDLIRSAPIDFVQVDYSLGNRDADDEILPAAMAKRIAVIVNTPFGGRRAGSLFSRVGDAEVPEWAADIGARNWSQVFLKYVVSHPAVTVAIPGTTQLGHFEENLEAVRGRMPDASMRTRIEKYWDQTFDG